MRTIQDAAGRAGMLTLSLVVLLMVVAVAIGACAISVSSCWPYEDDPAHRASREVELTAPSKGVTELQASTMCGRLEVAGAEGSEIRVRAVIKVRARDTARAEELAQQVRIETHTQGDKATISPKLPTLKRRELITVDLIVSVPWPALSGDATATSAPAAPPGRRLICKAEVGAVDVHDLTAAVRVKTSVGKTAIRNVTGPVHVRTSTGAIEVRQVAGGVDVTSDVGPIEVTAVAAPVRAETATGRIDISDVRQAAAPAAGGEAVWARTSVGMIHIRKVVGDVQAAADTGRVVVEDVRGKVTAHSSLGAVEVRDVDSTEPLPSD